MINQRGLVIRDKWKLTTPYRWFRLRYFKKFNKSLELILSLLDSKNPSIALVNLIMIQKTHRQKLRRGQTTSASRPSRGNVQFPRSPSRMNQENQNSRRNNGTVPEFRRSNRTSAPLGSRSQSHHPGRSAVAWSWWLKEEMNPLHLLRPVTLAWIYYG